ncbi:MAG TPA: GNAT family N-acetyltransferase [Rhodothermales bacterium]
MTAVRLRDVEPADLPVFFQHQRDPEGARMAAFTPRDRAAFDEHWRKNILGNPSSIVRTILFNDDVVGNVGSWLQDGDRLVGYWIGREHWGRGIATAALAAFLQVVTDRPLRAHAASRNTASIRVLEKCGFRFERSEVYEDLTESVFVLE